MSTATYGNNVSTRIFLYFNRIHIDEFVGLRLSFFRSFILSFFPFLSFCFFLFLLLVFNVGSEGPLDVNHTRFL